MPILGRKIQSECSPGTNVMSYRFKMPLANNSKSISRENPSQVSGDENELNHGDEDLQLRATCIYDQEEMRIYRMGE